MFRKHYDNCRVQTKPVTMTTEYQASFLPPTCYTRILIPEPKGPYHALKGTRADTNDVKLTYVPRKNIAKDPQPSRLPRIVHQPTFTPHNPRGFIANQMTSKMNNYTSVYKESFQAWKVINQEPFKPLDSLKVNQRLVGTNGTAKGDCCRDNSVQAAANAKNVQEMQLFESVTCYRYDYVSHPVQPRICREKSVDQSKANPKQAWDTNQQLFDEASGLCHQLKTQTLKKTLDVRGKAQEPCPPAAFRSTTHTDYMAHKCLCTKQVLPSVQTREKSKKPFQTISTTKNDYKAWVPPRRFPSVRKDHDRPKRSIFTPCTHNPAESCKTTLKPLGPHSKLNKTQVCNCSSNATKKTPAVKGAYSRLERIAPGTEKSRMGRGVTWAKGGICDEAPQVHGNMSCMASIRKEPSRYYRVQTKPVTMTTEYRDKFLPPTCYTRILIPDPKGPYHALKGTCADTNDVKLTYVPRKLLAKAPKPLRLPRIVQQPTITPHNPRGLNAKQMTSKMNNYTSAYKGAVG